MVRTTRIGCFTASKLRNRYAPMVSMRRIQHILNDDGNLRWVRTVSAPVQTTRHKYARLSWSRCLLKKGARYWRNVVFSDEECYGLGLCSPRGKSDLIFVDNTKDSPAYCAILGTTLLPYIEDKHPKGAVFQQDNASCHSLAYIKEWIMDIGMPIMDWPARSTD